jgi:2-haloacid dehalogenase
MLDLARFEFITFDCYGTLIDWESGILSALRPIFNRHGVQASDTEILEAYAAIESQLEKEYRPYREVLRLAVHELGERFGFKPALNEIPVLEESQRDWQPFGDSVAALQELARHYKLAIVSNIDDELFAFTRPKLQVTFADVITAQQCHSYKPSLNNFHTALRRLRTTPDKVLHAAQSRFHDIAPARELGIASVWVNRHHGQTSDGATAASNAVADLEVASMAELVDVVRRASASERSAGS